ncbi:MULTISPECIES: cyclopropane-fatty-acyl-phospholipid synthase family protein [unclassified Wenzhouxiangella]|uniref:SAM-dependent methyltransferase n=1 Tax=unclassified Wenzhouxiangella TaxID=2613841 RepID=UPI000E32C87A|nr:MULTISPECIES: cyclopropane-fatty-acyl-phospholipid synthase family protein [unclassified Wenzhouxiangella]RFF28779.1 class I SAM-dependent methyltransferase [Wenzhouxiangella sp. 15181]RFP67817.1 class I SAM-dependent methyltransferase [Wenzhouxiangella sp. 15190]
MKPIELAEKGLVPDWLIRRGIRALLKRRLRDEQVDDPEAQSIHYQALMDELAESAIAIETDAANQQHYEVPAAFYQQVLGRRLKYSSALWPPGVDNLDDAETAMLDQTCRNAELADGQELLELGCGWGSLTLWMAAQYPASRITAVSNSASQREHIESRARELRLNNLEVITCDVNELTLDKQFDRVVSVEMFEHVRNYRQLLERIAGWMKDDARLFVHIFCHRFLAYPFETEGEGNWMGRYFFTGGLMPATDTLLHFADDVVIERRWLYSGEHYARTARGWLDNLDEHGREVRAVMQAVYGEDAAIWQQRWRIFFMACEELFGFDRGRQWLVGHFRFRKAP